MFMVSPDVLEPAVQRIGHSINARSRHTLKFFNHRHLINLLLDWGTRDEQFKVQLFRFVDVLPALRTDEQFFRVFKEYFQDLPSLPSAIRWVLKETPTGSLRARVGTALLRRQFLKTAEAFMVGNSVEQALPRLHKLWRSGSGFSVDLLGEATVSEVEADDYQQRCLHTLQYLAHATSDWEERTLLAHDHLGPIPKVGLSIKISALYSHLDPIDPEGSFAAVASRLRPILDLACSLPASITFDMEQAELRDLTIDIFTRILSEEAYSTYPHASLALQTYLKDTQQTLEHLLIWARKRKVPIGIRLVKGAYWDSETVQYQQRGWPIPVFVNKAETDQNYEKLTYTLLENLDVFRPAFGTHNLRTLSHTQALANFLNIPEEAYEFQMLYGMTNGLQEAVIDSGHRMRIYTPVGELIPGMAYLVRRLLENSSNEGFIHKQQEQSISLDQLLSPPRVESEKLGPPAPSYIPHTTSTETDFTIFQNEPHIDFSQPDAGQPIEQAICHLRQEFGHWYASPLPTGGTASGPELATVNPSSPNEVIAKFQSMAIQDIPVLIEAAKSSLPAWRNTPPHLRIQMLFHTASLMRKRRSEFIALEILETGKPWREADADVAEAIDFLEFYGRQMHQISQATSLRSEPGEANQLRYYSRGLAAIIAPWNFSLAIPTGMLSAALVTGNIALFKPSERATMVGYQLYRLFLEAGIPKSALYFLPGGPNVGQSLVQHPDIHLIAFTGSKDVGLEIISKATHVVPGQHHVKHVIAEMGGKNAIIVDETADLDQAVTGVLTSAIGYQGQKCSACSRVIVIESIHEVFLYRLKQAALSVPIGPPEHSHHRMGPLIDSRALDRVRHYVEIGKEEGTCVLDRQFQGPGFFQGPVIFTDIEPHHRLAQEEIFGPIMAVMKATDFHHALELANNSCFALTGGMYSRSPHNIEKACTYFDVGNLYINRASTGALVGRQPFGGHRLSGVGTKAGGEHYLRQFMIERVISENTLRRGFAPTT